MMRIGVLSVVSCASNGVETLAPPLTADRGHDRLSAELGCRERQKDLAAHTPLLTCLHEQQVAARRCLAVGEVVGSGAELIERLTDLLGGDRFLVGWKARSGAAGLVDPVPAEQEYLLRLPPILRLREPLERAIEGGDARCDVGWVEVEILKKLQLRAARAKVEPCLSFCAIASL
jgi:hypothetical protein